MSPTHKQNLPLPRTKRGQTTVEFALTLPILLLLMFGVIEFGRLLMTFSAVFSAAREAARYGATLPISSFSSESDWLQAVEDRLTSDAEGQLDTTQTGVVTCVAVIEETKSSTTVYSLWSNDASKTSVTCFDDERAGSVETRVQVSATRQTELNALLFSTDITISSNAVALYERED